MSTGAERAVDASVTDEALRLGLSAALCAAAAAHVPVLADHLHEAPWLGCLFIAFIAAALVLGALGITRPHVRTAPIAGTLLAGAVAFYAATRTVAFPQISHDVGEWLDPWGVVSVIAETAGVLLALTLMTRRRPSERQLTGAPSQERLADFSPSDETDDAPVR